MNLLQNQPILNVLQIQKGILMSYKEEQLDLIARPKPRGGKRLGAGRKSKRGPTYVARIPEAYRDAVERLVGLLDEVEQDKLPDVKVTIK